MLNMILTVAALIMFGSTLTLPGIAGLILGIGMAVDSNVLIFERIREELRLGFSVPEVDQPGIRPGVRDDHRYAYHDDHFVGDPLYDRFRARSRDLP